MNNNDIERREVIVKLYDKFYHFLTQNQKQIMHFYFIENLSYGEIAKILVTTRSAVFNCVKLTTQKLEKINSKMMGL